ncbi:beta-1,3-glucosyltransferase [Diabrotica undecimpunctata]|uniref:beta-1,3-glucosyltransferase n=1 Tax=Diabrotica undecimpunctata TaxID=50387 RepID=UPI003B63AD8B
MIVLVLLFWGVVSALDIQHIVFVIISQNNKYNLNLAQNLEYNIRTQSERIFNVSPVIHISNKDFPDIDGWIFSPLFPKLTDLYSNNAYWIFFLQDYTNIKVENILEVFEKYDHNEEIWFGDALFDKAATIIHHFAFYENPTFFKYPNVASGFAISISLLRKLSERWTDNKLLSSNFNIDSGYELARVVWNDGNGPMLQHENSLCSRSFDEKPVSQLCISFPSPIPTCDNLVPRSSIYFAVKTCTKFHKDRVPIVQQTWGRHISIIKFFSDTEDKSIPTIDLGVPNSETGHCMKTIAILKYVLEDIKHNDSIKWIVVADDDTILGVKNLERLLSCYDSSEKICLGERYGYELRDPGGYNYITGGGGMVFSRPLLIELVKRCSCPSLNTPDDMYLGICMARMNVAVTHSPAFHQARPQDYSPRFLETYRPVSFHKHYMIDPVNVYKQWFESSDITNTNELNETKIEVHNEL